MKQARELPARRGSSMPLSYIKFNLRCPPICHDLIKIPLILNRIIQADRFVLIVLIHPTVITAPKNKHNKKPKATKNENEMIAELGFRADESDSM